MKKRRPRLSGRPHCSRQCANHADVVHRDLVDHIAVGVEQFLDQAAGGSQVPLRHDGHHERGRHAALAAEGERLAPQRHRLAQEVLAAEVGADVEALGGRAAARSMARSTVSSSDKPWRGPRPPRRLRCTWVSTACGRLTAGFRPRPGRTSRPSRTSPLRRTSRRNRTSRPGRSPLCLRRSARPWP